MQAEEPPVDRVLTVSTPLQPTLQGECWGPEPRSGRFPELHSSPS